MNVPAFITAVETILLMQWAGELVEIKTFTGKKTLMNAVASVLHTYLYGAGGI